MQSLFEKDITPLASLLRPERLDDLVGQSHLIGEGKPIRKFIEAGRMPSILLWGPPGCGKTSLARVIANSLDAEFHHLSAVLAKKEDVIKVIAKAGKNFKEGRQTILFLDEIHRWTKSQQDVLLPWVEKGVVTLIGATTENPSFTVINALLSRCRTYILESIKEEEIILFLEKNMEKIRERYKEIDFGHQNLDRSLPLAKNKMMREQNGESEGGKLSEPDEDKKLLSEANEFLPPSEPFGTFQLGKVQGEKNPRFLPAQEGQKPSTSHSDNSEGGFSPGALALIAHLGNGDLRNTLNLLETACILQGEGALTRETVLSAGSKSLMYDQDGEEHYNLISAMHKSLRDSDGDAAIYWIGRMLAGGEDPRYIARRMINFASEDVYDPTAMILANATYDICEKMGMPECELPMLNTAYYLANLPKDNSVYMAMQAMHQDIREYGNLGVPLHLRNAPTELMREAGYGKGYVYVHDLKSPPSKGGQGGSVQEHFPEELKGRKYRKN